MIYFNLTSRPVRALSLSHADDGFGNMIWIERPLFDWLLYGFFELDAQ